jgi:uncharacterized protein (TIGR02145 family)
MRINYIKYNRMNIINKLIFTIFIIGISGCEKIENSGDPETGTVMDIDNNVYSTIKIGDQWWMTENLRAKRFRNGNSISFCASADNSSWASSNVPLYCKYDDNGTTGLLYNAYAVCDVSIIAPEGWHVASDDDWKKLESYLGMNLEVILKTGWRGTHEGEKIKMKGLDYWKQYENVWATNETGFSAVAGGCRLFDGQFSTPTGLMFNGFWWCSDEGPDGEVWYRHLDYKNANIFRQHADKKYGFSIRCVKNN